MMRIGKMTFLFLPLVAACGGSASSADKTKEEESKGQLVIGGFGDATAATCMDGFVKLGFDVEADLVVTLSKSGDTDRYKIYTDKECKEESEDNVFTIAKGVNFASVYLRFSAAGQAVLGASAEGYDDAELKTFDVAAGKSGDGTTLGKLALGPIEKASVGECVTSQVEIEEAVDVELAVTIDVSGADNVAIFSDAACSKAVADRVVTIKGNVADLFVKFLTPGTQTLDASAEGWTKADTVSVVVTDAASLRKVK